MKALRFAALLFVCAFILSSCAASEKNDVYYIHACGFDERNDRLIFTVLLEKSISENEEDSVNGKDNGITGMSDNENAVDAKYFTDSFDGENIGKCAQSFFEKYPDCYSGKNDVYLFSESLDAKKLYDIAVYIPSVPGLPAGSGAVCVSSVSCSELLEKFAKDGYLAALKFDKENQKVNAVRFFAMCTSPNKKVKIPILKYGKNANIHFDGKATYKNCAVVTG